MNKSVGLFLQKSKDALVIFKKKPFELKVKLPFKHVVSVHYKHSLKPTKTVDYLAKCLRSSLSNDGLIELYVTNNSVGENKTIVGLGIEIDFEVLSVNVPVNKIPEKYKTI